MADDLATWFLPRGEAELISEFAFPLPLMVIMELLGLPEADRDQFHQWARMTVPRGPDSLPEEMAGYAAIREYFVDLIARKTRESAGDDLLSALVAVRDEGQRLDEDELLGMAWLLLTAGHSTTVDLIGSGTLALLRNPDQHAALRADPSRMPARAEQLAAPLGHRRGQLDPVHPEATTAQRHSDAAGSECRTPGRVPPLLARRGRSWRLGARDTSGRRYSAVTRSLQTSAQPADDTASKGSEIDRRRRRWRRRAHLGKTTTAAPVLDGLQQ